MRKVFLTLMVLLTILGSAITGAGSFISMDKFLKGVDFDKVAQVQTQLDKITAEGVDLTKNPEHVRMAKIVKSTPSKTTVMATKGLSVLVIVVALAMCVTTFAKKDVAIKMAMALAVLAIILVVIVPDLKGGMTGPKSLKMTVGLAVGMLVFAAASSFGAMKKIAK